MASCGHGTTNPSRTRGKSRKWEAPVLGHYSRGWRGACMYRSVPPPVPEPRRAPGTRHIPSLLLVRIPSGGQSKWQAGRWAMSSPFLSCKFLSRRRPLGLHLSCSRLRCRDWSNPGTVPFATSLGQSLCASHRASTQQRHAPPSPSRGSRGPRALDISVPRL